MKTLLPQERAATYIYYNDIVVAVVEDGKASIRKDGVERSNMPPQWGPHILRLLENSLPEGERRDVLLRFVAQQGERLSNPIELTPYVADLPGRFSAGHSAILSENGDSTRRFIPLPDIIPQTVIESRLSPDFFDPLSELRANEPPSFSGYQDKFTANLRMDGDKLLLEPVNQKVERGNVIVKPAHLKYPFIAENELLCMELAGKTGLPAPRVFLFRQPDIPFPRQHLVVERFDIRASGAQNARLNITEFAPLMGLLSEQKYDATTETLFSFAEKNLSKEDMKLLAKVYLFGYAVGNGDMHAKNFSIMIENNIPRLTPVYDMVNTAVYGISDTLALKLTNDSRPATASVVSFLRKYLALDEMETVAGAIKENLAACSKEAFRQTDSANGHKFKDTLEQSISGGSGKIFKATKRIRNYEKNLP